MSPRIIAKLKTPRIKSISLHPSNKTVALTLYNGTFILYSTIDFKPTVTARVSDLPLRCSAYLGDILCLGCDDTYIYLYENDKKVCAFQAHKDFIRRIETINNFILTCSDDTTIKMWKYENGQVTLVSLFEGHTHFVMDLQIVKNYDTHFTFVSSSLDGTVRLWSSKQKTSLYVLLGHSDGVNSATSINNAIVSCSDDLTTKIWDNQKCVHTIRGHTKNINRVRYFNNFFCTMSEDGYIKIYNSKSYKLEMNQNLQMERVWDCVYVNNALFIVCDEGMTVFEYGKSSFNIQMSLNKIIYNENESIKMIKTKNVNFERELQFLDFCPSKIRISEDGKLLGVCNGHEIIVYSILGMRVKKQIEGEDFIFIDSGLMLKQRDKIQVQGLKDDLTEINAVKNMKNLIGAKNESIYAITTNDNFTKIFYKAFLIFEYQICKTVIFYDNYAIFLGESIFIVQFDYEIISDYLEQGIEPEDHFKVMYKGNRKVDEYYTYNNILYFSSNSKLFYIILQSNKLSEENKPNDNTSLKYESVDDLCCEPFFIEIYYGTFDGKFIGVYENEAYFYDKKVTKKEIKADLLNWQQNILYYKSIKKEECDLKNYLANYDFSKIDKNSCVDFLISLQFYNEALIICNDNNKKFELLMKMKNYKEALFLANNNSKLKALMKEFVKQEDFESASECALKAKDYESLFLTNAFTNKFDKELENCGKKNLEFFSAFKNGNYKKCEKILCGTVFENAFKKSYILKNTE